MTDPVKDELTLSMRMVTYTIFNTTTRLRVPEKSPITLSDHDLIELQCDADEAWLFGDWGDNYYLGFDGEAHPIGDGGLFDPSRTGSQD
jgi:hypothetical protein